MDTYKNYYLEENKRLRDFSLSLDEYNVTDNLSEVRTSFLVDELSERGIDTTYEINSPKKKI